MSPDHQYSRFLPIKVVDAVKEVFKDDVEIFYVDDTDIIRVIFSIGTICFTLDLELGKLYGSSEKEYLMKSLSLDGSHNLFDNELKKFFDYDRDLKRLRWLEIQLSGMFSVVSKLYNPDFTDCASSAVVENVEDQLGAGDNFESGFEPRNDQLSVGSPYEGEPIDQAVLQHKQRLEADCSAPLLPAALAPVLAESPYRDLPKTVLDAAPKPPPRPQYIWTRKTTYQVAGGAVLGALLAWPLASHLYSSLQHKDTIPVPVRTTARRQPLLPRSEVPIVRRTIPSVPACPTYTIISTAREGSIAKVLRRMQREQSTVFQTYHFTPGQIIALSISPRHHAQASARDANDTRHALGAAHNYHFGRVITGDQFTIKTCMGQQPVFTHLRAGVTLYSFSLR